MWEVLGIAPTDDPKAIRRAYAARLKQIDPDRDREGFGRLRRALEWGLARAARAAQPVVEPRPVDPPHDLAAPVEILREALDRDTDARVAPLDRAPRGGPRRVSSAMDETAPDRSLLVDLEAALQRRDAHAAARCYVRASATGALPLGDAERMLARLFTVALADTRFGPADFRSLAKTLGWDRPELDSAVVSHVRQRVFARLAAEDWYDNLLAAADRTRRVPRRRRRVVRLLLRRIRGWALFRIDRPTLQALLDEYAHYEAWLHDRIDPAWVGTLKRRMRRRELFAHASLVLFLGAMLLDSVIVFVGGATGLLNGDSSIGFLVILPIAGVLIWFIKLLLRGLVEVWRRPPDNPKAE